MSHKARSLARLADDLDAERAGWKLAAREKKASALAACLWAAASHERRRDPKLPADVAAAPEAWWATVAEQAGVHAPSPETVRIVVEKVAELVNAELAALGRERACLQCFRPIAGAKPWPAAAPAWCSDCEKQRYQPRARIG